MRMQHARNQIRLPADNVLMHPCSHSPSLYFSG
jgi:hypothetical protein